jgi:hypothetical protein
MARKTGMLITIAFLIFGSGCAQSRADGYQVDSIWWNIIINFNNSGQTVCVAKQWNPQTLTVQFDVFPVLPNNPHHGTATAQMVPFQFYRIFGWLDGTKPNPQCIPKSWR